MWSTSLRRRTRLSSAWPFLRLFLRGVQTESLPGAGWRRSGRLAPVTEEERPRPWQLPLSGGLQVRPQRPDGAAVVFARRSDRRALRSRSCVPSVELAMVYRCCSWLRRLPQLMNPTIASFLKYEPPSTRQSNVSVSLGTTDLRLLAAVLPCPPMTDQAGAKRGNSARPGSDRDSEIQGRDSGLTYPNRSM